MHLFKQLGIIFGICWLSLLIEKLLPFTFPANVIGMVLLVVLLLTGIIKLKQINTVSDFLLGNMTILFIPATVGLINYVDILTANFIPIIVISVVSTLLCFGVTAFSIRLTLRFMNRRKHHE